MLARNCKAAKRTRVVALKTLRKFLRIFSLFSNAQDKGNSREGVLTSLGKCSITEVSIISRTQADRELPVTRLLDNL